MTASRTAAEVAAALQEELPLLRPGTLLPSDQLIADRFGVGRGTVRGVMAGLERRGLVRRERGAGTWWLGDELITDVSAEVPSFSAFVRGHGHVPGAVVLARTRRRAVKEERDYLGLPANSVVWKLQRVFTVDGEPVAFATSVLPFKLLPAMPTEFAVYGSIYETLQRRYGLSVHREWKRRREVAAPEFAERALGLGSMVPFRLFESLNVDETGTAVEYARTFARWDEGRVDALLAARR